ncbi:retropepsin-like aspartic protease family protein [Sphingomonas nostoxanthinifaciens]|uniref:retropepsin-like aspartic protease family protein n=1 Tax=Sphingomonas nostoxanthinifaciens TaxID=2872652 RepID=UPI001CC1E673|nr:TIGR02281 family clan AA aspartic protease [Sphingomonas nostoxanthinifaciens]UAK25425.1 TIGR02281 family clan AA aspartic protease [Sphingomonas nostoxanthinifaciens]
MPSLARYLPLAATLLVAPLTFAWGANMVPIASLAADAPHHATVEVARASDGLFYADVPVNGRKIHFLIDTGANVMMLTEADAKRVGIALRDVRYGGHVATASGRAAMAWTRVERVELAGRTMSDVRAGVVAHGLEVSLLGQNMLSKLGSVTIEGDTLRMD